ncbi:MAG: hypothetical protein INR69_20310, partial [Mucilaginibacter polytrichastri]|nr:hypothetical protein [Mucilaginibacter polytrichastri]
LTAPGGYYVAFLDEHLNYVRGLRNLLLSASAGVLNLFGYHTKTSVYELLVVGHGKIIVVYSCLGLGIMSFFAAFALSWPAPWRVRTGFLFGGLIFIQLLNILRFVLLSLFWNSASGVIPVDHHLVYNAIVYLVLVGVIYLYINHPKIKRYAYR